MKAVVIEHTAKQVIARETADLLIQSIAERDQALAEALSRDWDKGRPADSPTKSEPLFGLAPKDQLLFQWRERRPIQPRWLAIRIVSISLLQGRSLDDILCSLFPSRRCLRFGELNMPPGDEIDMGAHSSFKPDPFRREAPFISLTSRSAA